MKTKYLIITICLFSSILLGKDATGNVNEIKTFEKSVVSANGKTIYIIDSRADILISRGSGNQITVKATIELGDMDPDVKNSYLKNSQLILEPYRQGYRINLSTPDNEWAEKHTSFISKIFSINCVL